MSKTAKVIYGCDHSFEIKQYRSRSKTLERSAIKDVDLIDTEVVSKIFKVTQDSNLFVKDIDYTLFMQNQIKWIGLNIPAKCSNYQISFETVKRISQQYEESSCPRCGGNGWYVGILDNNTNKFSDVTGAQKMSQDFMKILLTLKNGSYGTQLSNEVGKNIINSSISSDRVISEIYDAELQYQKIQSELMISGTVLPDEEKLYKIEVKNIDYDDLNKSFLVDVILYSFANQKVRLSLEMEG